MQAAEPSPAGEEHGELVVRLSVENGDQGAAVKQVAYCDRGPLGVSIGDEAGIIASVACSSHQFGVEPKLLLVKQRGRVGC